jgi:hypothetical protein
MDDFRIFNYVRTPAQIAWDYNRGRPVGWWKFDECQGSVAVDSAATSSVAGNNGTIVIGATVPQSTLGTCTTPIDGTGAWYNGRVGKFNSALSFDGVDDYVDSNLAYSANYKTITLWARGSVDKLSSAVIFGMQNPSDQRLYFGYDSGGNLGIGIGSSAWGNEGNGYTQNTNWHFYVFTYDNNIANLYIDTILKATKSGSTSPTGNYHIGHANGASATSYFRGLIDDVKVYNYVLTSQQVLLDYNQGSAVRFGPTAGRP